jgi:hypothetical protein
MESVSYRVELHQDGEIQVLGRMTHARAHFRTLDPFLSQLTRERITGWLLLVDERTNEIVARRRVDGQDPPEPVGSPDPSPSRGR